LINVLLSDITFINCEGIENGEGDDAFMMGVSMLWLAEAFLYLRNSFDYVSTSMM